jgi:ankyrin repeat protein
MPNALQSLLARGANPNASLAKDIPGRGPEAISLIGATPLFLAAEVGNAAAVRVLASKGADIGVKTNQNTTPLMVAAGVGHFEDDREVLATRSGRRETAKLLVELGADVNAVGENGWTALHGAAYTGSDDTIQLLVEHGASIDKMDRFGQTALSIAEGVITVGLGDDAVRRARNVRQITANLLLKLGATPVEQSGVQIVIRKLQ